MLIFSTSVRLLKMIAKFIDVYRTCSPLPHANVQCQDTHTGSFRESWTKMLGQSWWTDSKTPTRVFSSCSSAPWPGVWV